MGETSRREFLRSSAAAAAVVSGSSFFEDETLFANSSKSLAIKKGLVYSMLPLTLSHLERFKLAREVGFEVVQAPTTSDERTAEEMKAAADSTRVRKQKRKAPVRPEKAGVGGSIPSLGTSTSTSSQAVFGRFTRHLSKLST